MNPTRKSKLSEGGIALPWLTADSLNNLNAFLFPPLINLTRKSKLSEGGIALPWLTADSLNNLNAFLFPPLMNPTRKSKLSEGGNALPWLTAGTDLVEEFLFALGFFYVRFCNLLNVFKS